VLPVKVVLLKIVANVVKLVVFNIHPGEFCEMLFNPVV